MWIACTLLGGVLFGITPSTVALYTVARKTALGEEDIPVFSTFWRTYKAEFIKANMLGGFLIVLGLVWYIDLRFFGNFEGSVYSVLNMVMILVGIFYILLLFYIFPVYVHYEMKFFNYIKYTVAFGFLHPLNFIAMIITVLSTYQFLIFFQGFIPLFGFSLIAQLNMWLAYQSFKKVADKHARFRQKEKYSSVSA
jgi:uncharacterized membrane protein YesL